MERPLTDENIRAIFAGAADFIVRQLRCGQYILYSYAIDGLISGSEASEFVFKPIAQHRAAASMQELYDFALHGGVYNCVADPCEDLDTVALKLVNGFCLVLFPGVGAIAYEVKTGEKRGISQPTVEHTAKGAKDAFVETARSNTSLLRRHLRAPDLRIEELQVGTKSLTNVSMVWLAGVTDEKLVAKMRRRLQTVRTDSFVTPAAAEELITGGRATAFPLLQYTERTDRFADGLLSGRIGVLIDGIPLGYMVPVTLGDLMDSSEDYSRSFFVASAIRILRYLALAVDLLLPALYLAMTMHHWDLLPPAMAQVITQGREGVPFSPIWEILTLLIAFELLQESGVHLPQSIGQSVSIIGGIVVGTAGVEAGLISSSALIAVSVAGVCGYVLPNRDFADAIRLWRFVLAAAGAAAGLWGVAVGALLLLIRLICLRSMGVPYLSVRKIRLLRRRVQKPHSGGV